MNAANPVIDVALVRHLLARQFPRWSQLPVQPVDRSGWDNRTFRLGNQLLVRLPSAERYAAQVECEQRWLPTLAPQLPQPIPAPVAMGRPDPSYPWPWSIYRWIEGESAASGQIADLSSFARDLGAFLRALQRVDPTGGPAAGPQNFHRGGSLLVYDAETRQAIAALRGQLDSRAATAVWEAGLATSWVGPPVWVHGDVSVGNLLLSQGRLSAVIDFGQLATGDPACDLAIRWTLFHGASGAAFQAALPLDAGTWARGRAWALWKAVISAAALTNTHAVEGQQCWRTLERVLTVP